MLISIMIIITWLIIVEHYEELNQPWKVRRAEKFALKIHQFINHHDSPVTVSCILNSKRKDDILYCDFTHEI